MKPRHVPDVGDVYRARDGVRLMRVERIHGGRAYCRYLAARRRAHFVLPIWFLRSFACGWTYDRAESPASHKERT
jgi:hypothetical protein